MLNIPQMIIAILLYFVLFFGIGFILNMLLRSTWTMAVIYPIVIMFIVGNAGFFSYFTNPGASFTDLGESLVSLAAADAIILTAGFIGAVLSGIANKMLRDRGYQMF
ncbi:YuiB family protein [Salisediminibacterium halotolerans]|uniref:Membrane protein n=1 Tax=Salisediminibacterium halotolerans TaxID=517425 RepID=A0A1H9WST9_9BACI|nr:YuiB family protein [Salisediminibacterium haloalkalitolerans]SES36453.1 Putative membrane protein [Salisediminibacterium haloalkalitolerans]